MRSFAPLLVLIPAAAAAAPIAVVKTAVPVADGVNALNPRVLPGGAVEYTLAVTNPLLNPDRVTNVMICDVLPASVALATADLAGSGAGPVAFTQGVVGSGLAYAYGGLGSPSDGLAFFDADGAAITPVAGTDARVRRVCVTLTGARMAAGGSFQLRYRGNVQ